MSSTSNPTHLIPYDSPSHQRHAAIFGLWVFLVTEILFFGGMIVGYVVYHYEYPEAFREGSRTLNVWAGGAMTAVLLLGSLLIAVAEHLTEEGDRDNSQSWRGTAVWRLAVTACLGVVFLGLEFYEYHELIGEGLFPGSQFARQRFTDLPYSGRAAELFFLMFFCMTGLHAFHMIVGILLVGGIGTAIQRARQPERLGNTLTVIALYWHFVDIVWIFLYPLFYLVR
ncbi:MAG: cytochrome c oxidase subunit 3 [Planctomycetaceae bacterium]|nr:cytochrome c oxidase subunit 3 [Planctomycetaceae bacterium]